jgi:hypothetical protein
MWFVDARLGQRPLVGGSVAPFILPNQRRWRGICAAYRTIDTDYTRTDQAKHGEAVRAQLPQRQYYLAYLLQ